MQSIGATYQDLKDLMRAVKVTGAHIAKNATKIEILAMKLVQRSYTIGEAMNVVHSFEDDDEVSKQVLTASSTSARIRKGRDGSENI